MQKYSLSLWLFALIACMQFGNALAAKPTAALSDVHCNTHKELLKADLSRLSVRHAMLANSLHWKSVLHTEAIALGLLSITYATLDVWRLYPQQQWIRDFKEFIGIVNMFTGFMGLIFTFGPLIDLMRANRLRNECIYLEKEIATIKD